MRKFSKIFESKETLLSKLGSSEEEIKDICSELIDEGYKVSLSSEYIGVDGHIYRDENETSKYYPCIEIDLHRDTSNRDDHYGDREVKDQFNDVRMWNGGVYYEGNINLLKTIYELCYRFESTFTSDDAEVYYSMRSINEVIIRITFKLIESEGPIDFAQVNRFLGNQALDLDDNFYDIEDSMTSDGGKNRSVTIHHLGNGRLDRGREETIKRMVKDDSEYLGLLVKGYVERVLEEAKKSAKSTLTLKSKGGNHDHDFRYYIMCGDRVLVSFEGDLQLEDEREIVVAKGIFKDRKEKISIRSVYMKVRLHY